MLLTVVLASPAFGQIKPVKNCDASGIGSVTLKADAPVTITSVTAGLADQGSRSVPYCLVQVLIPQAIHIWVGLPMEGQWNGRLQSEGGGGYSGYLATPTYSVSRGYVGVQTDTGHVLGQQFALASPGTPNTALLTDFAYRSQHLMAVVGKQLAVAFYGQAPARSYWNGCSEGGREGLRMAQDFPGDYDGILAGAPAVSWDRLAASQTWPHVVMKDLAHGPVSALKQKLATAAAIAACDTIDGVRDGVLTDPRACRYSASADKTITRAGCARADNSCLTPGEAAAIDRIWAGPSDAKGEPLWPGIEPGSPIEDFVGTEPSLIHWRYWIYLDPEWDWHRMTIANYERFFRDSVQRTTPLLPSDNPDLSAFRARGGKLLSWHGFSDAGIMPQGTIRYYDSVVKFSDTSYTDVQKFYRLFMAPGVGHCGHGDAPVPGIPRVGPSTLYAGQEKLFDALVNWVEHGQDPKRIIASQALADGTKRTRPLCPYPAFAQYMGHGSTDDADNFTCADTTPQRISSN